MAFGFSLKCAMILSLFIAWKCYRGAMAKIGDAHALAVIQTNENAAVNAGDRERRANEFF